MKNILLPFLGTVYWKKEDHLCGYLGNQSLEYVTGESFPELKDETAIHFPILK